MTAKGRHGRLVVISGPSGVGKGTINREVLRRTGAEYSVSVTTRPPRAGEKDGCEYRFVDRTTFERMIEHDQLLEWAEVFGHRYGTPAEPIRRAIRDGRTILLEIDAQGGIQVHQKMPEAVFILIVPPGIEDLQQRLRKRGTETDEAFAARLSQAAEELRRARDSGAYAYEIVNDDLDQAIEDVVEIINNA